MKSIFKYIALTSLALVSGLTAVAQNLPEGTYEGKNGIAYRKSSALKPGSTDTYIVNLETFVYGEVTVSNDAVPADIVLVLDVSGSMDDPMSYSARTSQSYSYAGYNENEKPLYYFYNNNYYKVEAYQYSSTRYYLRFEYNNQYYYLRNNNTPTTSRSNGSYATGSAGPIWTGVLYDANLKIDALKTAVNAFIDKIQENDLWDIKKDDDGNEISRERRKDEHGNDTSLGNQISIVKFAEPTYYSSSTSWVNGSNTTASITPGNHFPEWRSSGGNDQYRNFATDYYASSSNTRYNCTEVLQGFTSTASNSDVNTLKNAVSGLIAAGSTASDYGMNLARLLLESIKNTRTESSKTVVMFTDGEPNHYNGFDSDVATACIGHAYTMKSSYDATVFSVGVFDSISSNLEDYMNYTSSNYPNARSMSQPNTPIPLADRKFYQNASGADLTAVFTTIANASGGSGATNVTSESAVTVDVVATSFSLPEGITKDDITVTVAPCTGQTKAKETMADGKERLYYTFGVAKPAKGTGYTNPDGYPIPVITPDVDPAENMVSTSGFDFSENWCGYDATPEVQAWRGYKQIISFEIKLKEDAVGGPNVATNDKRSGIYVNNVPVAEFNRPTVKVPVSIWVKKQGLAGEDSAVFNIQYAEYQEDVDPTTLPKEAWKSFTKIIVNCYSPVDTDGCPMVKLVGLDPDYFYRVKEDAWAWSYSYQDQGTQYVFGEDQHNPFTFVNTPKTDIVKEAEATVRNIFNENTTTSSTTPDTQ